MVEIRAVAPDELAAFLTAVSFGFGGDRDPADLTPEALERVRRTLRTEALLVGCDPRGRIVATLGSFDFDLTVPGGGTVAMAGTTQVTVQANHRRQGVLTRLLARHLAQAREEGRAVAGLWASDEAIYRRFGYGRACDRLNLSFSGPDVGVPAGPADVELRYLEPAEAREVLPAVYEQARLRRAGHLSRSPAWWEQRHWADGPGDRDDGEGALRWVLAERAGQPVGYVAYRQRFDRPVDGLAQGEVHVHELIPLDDGARRALWHLIGHVDLYPEVTYDRCAVDEPLLAEVDRFRRLSVTPRDALWLRPLDVPAALAARRYEHDGTLVLRVVDGAGLAGGTWRLEVAGGQAACTPAPGTGAEVTLGPAELGALYLGGTPARTLARAGRIDGTEASVGLLHRLFHTVDAPHHPENF